MHKKDVSQDTSFFYGGKGRVTTRPYFPLRGYGVYAVETCGPRVSTAYTPYAATPYAGANAPATPPGVAHDYDADGFSCFERESINPLKYCPALT